MRSGVRNLGGGVEMNVLVGQRFEVDHIIRAEAQRHAGNMAVVVCGPPAMADDVRHCVVQANRKGDRDGLIRLYEECYSF